MPLLSTACKLCHEGAKMVLFVTGRCNRTCWYCPISSEKKGKDTAYANDRVILNDDDILEEAWSMEALGAGVTGGEPLLVPERVHHYCTLLKQEYGEEFNIHLYTGMAPTEDILLLLKDCVDEIRFHLPEELWENFQTSAFPAAIRTAKNLGFQVTIEVPSLPGLNHLIPAVEMVDYFNINELEWSETNADAMRERYHSLEDNYHNAVEGAEVWAEEILKNPKVHWCSSSFKDSVQLRNRLIRTAEITGRQFEEVTDDGTLLYGVWEYSGQHHEIEEGMWEERDGNIETAWYILAEHPDEFPGNKYIIERYPGGGIIVEVIPL
ncbi:MAG: radical SAM protein [Methanogenium sp.]